MAQHYCVNCGIPLAMRIIEGREHEACGSCDFVLWHDPKVVTMVVIESAEGVLLGRRAIEPGYGAWCLPGGFVNDDEAPDAAAVRECREEIGAEVEILGLVGVYHISKAGAPSMVGIAYRARLVPGERPAAGDEMLEVREFAPGNLPELIFSSHRAAVRDWRQIGESSMATEPR
jgi:ADP-ribose pyrophosphatase YjhB (NUDIX family)